MLRFVKFHRSSSVIDCEFLRARLGNDERWSFSSSNRRKFSLREFRRERRGEKSQNSFHRTCNTQSFPPNTTKSSARKSHSANEIQRVKTTNRIGRCSTLRASMDRSCAQRPIVRLAYSSAGLSFLTAPQRYQERRACSSVILSSSTRALVELETVRLSRGLRFLSPLFPLPSSVPVSVVSSRSTRNSLDSPLDDPLRPRNRRKKRRNARDRFGGQVACIHPV